MFSFINFLPILVFITVGPYGNKKWENATSSAVTVVKILKPKLFLPMVVYVKFVLNFDFNQNYRKFKFYMVVNDKADIAIIRERLTVE